MNTTNITRAAIGLALVATSLGAQQPASTLDRTAKPAAGKSPALVVPKWTTTTLANGAQLIVSERHGLPLVSFSMNFVGGAYQYEPADKTGLGSFVAAMLSEGTKTKTGDEISTALQMLGSGIGASIAGESGTLSFTSLKDKFEPTLAILADEMLNPAFPNDALERLRARTIVNITQNRDRTASVASIAFPKVLYGADHPYGRSISEASVRAITRDDLLAFHKNYYQPGRAVITVVGDITAAEAKAKIEKAFASWPSGGSKPAFTYPTPPAAKGTTIYVVDKPGAAQSSFAIGMVGPPRGTPDYYPLAVMNRLFGELFQSRINANIREQKGYSYGVSSRFQYGRGPGPFRAGGDIRTAVSDSALIEFMKEIKGMRGDRPVTDDELAAAKASLISSLPGRLASVGGVGGMINEVYVQGLAEDYWQQYSSQVNKVTKEDVMRVAKQYFDPDHMAIVIVGDRKAIEASLEATKIAPIIWLDLDGNVIPKRITP